MSHCCGKPLICLIAGLIACGMSGCCPLRIEPSAEIVCRQGGGRGDQRWLLPAGAPRGSVIVIHGLNNGRAVMTPLAHELTDAGYAVLQVTLLEDGADLAAAWLRQVQEAYCGARARYPGSPLAAVGYSTGGALAAAFMASFPRHEIGRAVLFAPAVSLAPRAVLLRPVLPLRALGIALPSLAPAKYRASPTTPLNAYYALFQLSDGLSRLRDLSGLQRASVLMLMSPDDGLVSYRGVERWRQRNAPAWRLEALRTESASYYSHLVVTPDGLGAEAWRKVVSRVESFLAGREPP